MKRLFDLLLACLLILILMPLYPLVAIMILITSRGPVIHWSERVGRNNIIFKMPKFRSMIVETPSLATHQLTHPQKYLTPIGGFLRKTSLDELPQIWSILKGDMSFVGPRPALFNQQDLIEMRSQLGLELLLPGLTGWAQVNGRDDLPLGDKVRLDQEYMNKKTLLFDLYILWRTFVNVVFQKNISH